MTLFNKIKKSARQKYYLQRKIVSIEDVQPDRVKVLFKDGFEEMTKAEFDAGVTDHEVIEPKERSQKFVDRTFPLRKAVADVFHEHNPRYYDLDKILDWVKEGYRVGYTKALSCAYGVESFEDNVTLGDVQQMLEKGKKDLKEDMTDIEKDLTDVLVKHKVKMFQIMRGHVFMPLSEKLLKAINSSIPLAVGVEEEMLRMEELDKIIMLYVESHKGAGEATPQAQSGNGDDSGGKK